MRSVKGSGGWSLIEVMMTMGIALTLAAISIPSMAAFLDSVQQKSLRTQIVSDLNEARRHAIFAHGRVIMCAGNQVDGCVKDLDWGKTGWIACRSSDHLGEGDHQCDKINGRVSAFLWRGRLPASDPKSPEAKDDLNLFGSRSQVSFNSLGEQDGKPGEGFGLNIVRTIDISSFQGEKLSPSESGIFVWLSGSISSRHDIYSPGYRQSATAAH